MSALTTDDLRELRSEFAYLRIQGDALHWNRTRRLAEAWREVAQAAALRIASAVSNGVAVAPDDLATYRAARQRWLHHSCRYVEATNR